MKRMLQDLMGLFIGYDENEPTNQEMEIFYSIMGFMVLFLVIMMA